jgi:hypothetical protein
MSWSGCFSFLFWCFFSVSDGVSTYQNAVAKDGPVAATWEGIGAGFFLFFSPLMLSFLDFLYNKLADLTWRRRRPKAKKLEDMFIIVFLKRRS